MSPAAQEATWITGICALIVALVAGTAALVAWNQVVGWTFFAVGVFSSLWVICYNIAKSEL